MPGLLQHNACLCLRLALPSINAPARCSAHFLVGYVDLGTSPTARLNSSFVKFGHDVNTVLSWKAALLTLPEDILHARRVAWTTNVHGHLHWVLSHLTWWLHTCFAPRTCEVVMAAIVAMLLCWYDFSMHVVLIRAHRQTAYMNIYKTTCMALNSYDAHLNWHLATYAAR